MKGWKAETQESTAGLVNLESLSWKRCSNPLLFLFNNRQLGRKPWSPVFEAPNVSWDN